MVLFCLDHNAHPDKSTPKFIRGRNEDERPNLWTGEIRAGQALWFESTSIKNLLSGETEYRSSASIYAPLRRRGVPHLLSKGYINTKTRPTQPYSLPLRLSAHSYLCADTGEGVGEVIELFSPVGRCGSFCSSQAHNHK
jgi:hypothetical protein